LIEIVALHVILSIAVSITMNKILSQDINPKLLNVFGKKKFSSAPFGGRFIRHRVKRKGYKWKRFFKYRAYFQSMMRIRSQMPLQGDKCIKFRRWSRISEDGATNAAPHE
jgi:hypothetical protein